MSPSIYKCRRRYHNHPQTHSPSTQDNNNCSITLEQQHNPSKMKVTLVLSACLLVAVASAYPQNLESRAAIVAQENAANPDGSYRNNFQTENGIKQESVGYLKNGVEGPVAVFQGAVSYVAPDGQNIQTGYIADENGYQPYGSHLPTPPPIPVEIQESLRLLATLPSTPEPIYQ